MADAAKSCAGCAHFAALAEECRKNPPAVFPIMQPQGIAFVAGFPPMKPTNWCGSFEARPGDG